MLSNLRRIALRAVLALACLPFAAFAANFPITVDDNADYAFGVGPTNVDGTGCTLRKALSNAFDGAQTFTACATGSAGVGDVHIITFSAAGDIQLGTIGTLPFVKNIVTITGPKIIKGVNAGLGQAEIFHIANDGDLTLTSLTLQDAGNSAIRMDGNAKLAANVTAFNNNKTDVCCGGAIGGNGTIALANVTFDGNTANSGGSGGAINLSSTGISTITDANFSNNSAAEDGGAIYVSLSAAILPPSTLTITNGVFFNNTASGAAATRGGGAIHARASGVAFVSLLNNQFIGNDANGNDGRGGAIYNGLSDAYPMIVDHAVFLLNNANANAGSMGGAIYNADNIIVRASSFVGNAAGPGNGGAIATDARPPDNGPTPPEPGAIIANSTFNANTAAEGAAIYSFGQFTPREVALVNVTIDGNTASGTGGGIRTDNIGGGTATTRLLNTIVSNNTPDNCTNDTAATQTNNVVGNLQFPGATCAADSAITTGDPKLNGASINPPDILTVTMSLQAGSAASSAGNNGVCAAFPVFNLDQRSLVVPIRPAGGPNCDIGAYESSMAPGYGSAPAPGATITITTVSGLPMTSNVVISETGDDNLTISSYSIPGGPQLTVAGTAAPFSINEGSGLTETLVLTCSSAVPFTTTQTLTVNHNAAGSPATYTVNCVVVDPLVITTPTPLPGGFVGTAYSQTFTATGGTPPYVSWQVVAGALPPGLTLDLNTGALTGTPTLVGPYNFTVQVSDSTGAPLTTTKMFDLAIVAAPSITTATPLPVGTTGTVYPMLTFAATGGSGVYTNWAVTLGSGPPGLILDPATGQVTGTPTLAGVYNFTMTVTDSLAQTGSKAFSLTIVDPLTITTPTPLPLGVQNVAYAPLTFTAIGGTPAYSNWQVILGALPAGMSLGLATGQLTGTPTAAGTFNFTVQVQDSLGVLASAPFSLTINPPLSITTATPLTTGALNVAYSGVTFAATGGSGAGYTNWIVTAGALPAGLNLAPLTGLLSGTPTVSGPFNFTVQVQDSLGNMATKVFDLTINDSLIITTATPLPGGTQNIVYPMVTFAATGGTPGYSNWLVIAGALPAGLTLANATGQLTGTPTAAGTFNFTVQVQDSVALTTTKAFSLTIAGALTITTATPLPVGTQNVVYAPLTFAATGGTPGYSNWQVTVGALPAGLTLALATGQLTGTPTVQGTFNFTVQVQDTVATLATKAFSLTINPPVSITTATPMPVGTVGTAYSQTFAATGGTPGYSNWTVTVGTLPAGLTLNPATGALTGTPTAAGTSNFTVQVQDSVGTLATKAFALTINPGPLTITTASPLPGGSVGTAYSQTFAAAGGTPAYSNWTVTVGTLPAGLTLNPATGALTGTPTTAGTSNFTVQVQDSLAATTTRAFALTISGTALTITTASPLAGGTVGTAYSQTFAATGGTPAYSNWTVTVGTLPAGLTLAPATGALTGTPTTAGTFNFTVQVQDSVAATTTKAFALTIAGGTLSITTVSPLPGGTVGTAYSQLFAATGGTPPYVNWVALVPAQLPAGPILNASSGLLSGTPATPGTFTFTIQVTDNVGATATKAFTVTIGAAGCFTGASPSGGTSQACVAGGGPTCTFAPGTAQFIPVTGHAASPPAGTAPSGILFPQGLFAFTLSGCTAGSSVTMTVTFPAPIPAGAQYWKYGPQPSVPAPSWYILPATFGANTVTFTIVDGGLGDDDLAANGTIVDQGGPGVPGGGGPAAAQTPTLSEWALILLATLILLIGLGRGGFAVRRRS